MEELKNMARAAKQRLKNNFWEECKRCVDLSAETAREKGLNEVKVKLKRKSKVKSRTNFILKSKNF